MSKLRNKTTGDGLIPNHQIIKQLI